MEVSIVTIGSDTSLGRSARAGLDGVDAQLRAREEEKCNHGVVRRLLNEAGNNTILTPIVMSACGAIGPSMVAFLKHAYGRAKDADKFLMSQQPALKNTWNTTVSSSFWDMRLSIACAATDTEFQNRIILHDKHPQPRRRGAAAPPRSQLRATRGGASPCLRLKDFGRHAMISESRTASPTQSAGVLDYNKDYL